MKKEYKLFSAIGIINGFIVAISIIALMQYIVIPKQLELMLIRVFENHELCRYRPNYCCH